MEIEEWEGETELAETKNDVSRRGMVCWWLTDL